jgi:hypothetical protein
MLTWSQWQLTLQQLARAKQLEAVVRRSEQALPLVLLGVVREQVLTLRHQTIVECLFMETGNAPSAEWSPAL